MPGAPSNQPCLTVLGGPMSGTQFVIEDAVDDILIGSDSSCRFCIPLPGVSPIHARIWLDAGGATVYDTHSPRGLYVNDDRVEGQAPLKNGDILWLGTPGEDAVVMIQCRLPRATPAPEPPSPAAEAPAATMVLASEPAAAPPAESEFYVEVDSGAGPGPGVGESEAVPLPEPAPLEATTVLAPAEIVEAPPPSFEEIPASRPTPALPAPLPVLDTEFEDETLEVAASVPPPAPEVLPEAPSEMTVSTGPPRPPEPTPVPAPAPPAPRTEPAPARPAPAAARPAAPRPAPAAPRPVPVPEPRPKPRSAAAPARGLAIAVGMLAILAVAGFFAWRWLRPAHTTLAPTTLASIAAAPPTTLPVAPPQTRPPVVETPAPAPPVEEVVTIVKSPSPRGPSPSASPAKPGPSPKAPPTPVSVATPAGPSPEEARAQQVAGLLDQAESAGSSRPEEALRLYDEALKLDPQNARALAGKATAQAAAAASRRRFVGGRTSIQGAKSKADLSGFDSADVQVADAPGRIEFEATPAGVKPGDSYAVRIFFVNESKKSIKVRSLSVSAVTNGARSGGPATPRAREIGAGQRVLLDEVTGVWKDGTNAWSLDVSLVSERNDSYRNQVSWR